MGQLRCTLRIRTIQTKNVFDYLFSGHTIELNTDEGKSMLIARKELPKNTSYLMRLNNSQFQNLEKEQLKQMNLDLGQVITGTDENVEDYHILRA